MEQAQHVAPSLKAFADPVRVRLLSLVDACPDGVCVCDLNEGFELTQPTISHHLNVLHQAGLLTRTKQGVWVYYLVEPDAPSTQNALLGGVAASATR